MFAKGMSSMQLSRSCRCKPALSYRTPSAQARWSITRAASAKEPQTEVAEEEDLWQYAERDQWYAARFAADDQPDWVAGSFLRYKQLTPTIREVVVGVEISRERIPLRNAYKHVGQRACVRINSGTEQEVPVSSPPFPQSLLREVLLTVRGDLYAEETKTARELTSVTAELSLFVSSEEYPDIYKLSAEDTLEIGPFKGSGLDLRGSLLGIFQHPTVVIFAQGSGIATAKALLLASSDVCGLNLRMRTGEKRLYYRARTQAALTYAEEYEAWEEATGVKVVTATRDSFADMFDDDDTLEYEPASTAAILLTGGDEESEEELLELCKEAEINCIVRQSVEGALTEYLAKGKGA
ncbi:hypothetical protein APUTEX25_001423 [Auxenochlorella protothecoides]|uniref:FAD-binding FR-type domain-containing protein n=1 Tax=Auxenochlorella protothecoides TaxID=3075 RepID=A0A3M7L505_AUXPR|nr:hypothetical protein APUTEX25_001423 [Auxenochlorella protothecoides]|eukprot:RMZ56576.1 hypothetical protein APUTEX25_001423 [Auxenochlorella protothecoides]